MNVNRKERRAVQTKRYAKAQWYYLHQLRRLADRNCGALDRSITAGNRNPLRVEYRGLN